MHRSCLAAGCLFIWTAFVPSPGDEGFWVGAFSDEQPGVQTPRGWRPLAANGVDRATKYRLVEEDGAVVLQAVSRAGASSLIRKVDVDPARHPVLTWRWRVDGVLEHGDARRKRGDDFPARIYVIFDHDPSELGFRDRLKYRALKALGYEHIPTRALNYIWANKAPRGRFLRSPYTDWVQMLPLQSGGAHAGQWRHERRNVYADYVTAFGEPPPRIAAIAVMTDTDNTGESATAYYGDLVLRREESPVVSSR